MHGIVFRFSYFIFASELIKNKNYEKNNIYNFISFRLTIC